MRRQQPRNAGINFIHNHTPRLHWPFCVKVHGNGRCPLITTKTPTTKKTEKESTKNQNIFVKFQAPFSQKIINIHY